MYALEACIGEFAYQSETLFDGCTVSEEYLTAPQYSNKIMCTGTALPPQQGVFRRYFLPRFEATSHDWGNDRRVSCRRNNFRVRLFLEEQGGSAMLHHVSRDSRKNVDWISDLKSQQSFLCSRTSSAQADFLLWGLSWRSSFPPCEPSRVRGLVLCVMGKVPVFGSLFKRMSGGR